MTAWTYYAPMPYADEYNDLRGGFKRCVFAYHDADRSLIPTTTWEGLRAGITDWRYIATLEEAISKAKGKRQERGITALREILAEVPWQDQAQTGWGNRRAAQLREKVVKAILDVSSGGDGKNWWHFWD